MTEILFYHLEQRPLDQVLPLLLEKTLQRDWKAIVEIGKPLETGNPAAGEFGEGELGEGEAIPRKTGAAGLVETNPDMALLDKALWTFRDDSFLPHYIYQPEHSDLDKGEEETKGKPEIDFSQQPILLCDGRQLDRRDRGGQDRSGQDRGGDKNPNNAQIRFYVAGAVPSGEGNYQRLVFMFDGHDPDAVIAARSAWKNLSKSHDATYWKQESGGGWIKKS